MVYNNRWEIEGLTFGEGCGIIGVQSGDKWSRVVGKDKMNKNV